jgi:DNA-binding NarL/FixJ family response regulator
MSCHVCCPNCGSFLRLTAQCISTPLERDLSSQGVKVSLNHYKLRPRMREAAEHLLAGMTNKQIADAMGIKVQVVKNYLKEVYDQIGCGNRTECVSMVLTGRRG